MNEKEDFYGLLNFSICAKIDPSLQILKIGCSTYIKHNYMSANNSTFLTENRIFTKSIKSRFFIKSLGNRKFFKLFDIPQICQKIFLKIFGSIYVEVISFREEISWLA